MTKEIRIILPAILVILGLGLIIAGIAIHKNGAVVVGLCVAFAAAYHIKAFRKQAKQGGK